MVRLITTRHMWWQKAFHKLKGLIIMKPYTSCKVFFNLYVVKDSSYVGFENPSDGCENNLSPLWVERRCLHGIAKGVWKTQLQRVLCKLKKAIYGLWQTSWVWNKRIDSFLKQKGFRQCRSNTNICMFK